MTTLGYPIITQYPPFTQIFLEGFCFLGITLAYYILLIEKKALKYVYAPGIAGMYFVSTIFLLEKTGAGLNPARILGLCLMNNYY